LGEEIRLTRIHDVEFVTTFEAGRKGIPIRDLKDHLRQLALPK